MSDRTFATHQIRRAVPVPTLWDFAALDTDAPVPARLPVPSAWELVPALHNYRGRAHYTTRIRLRGQYPPVLRRRVLPRTRPAGWQ